MGPGAFSAALDRRRHPVPLVSICLTAASVFAFLFPSAAGALEYDRAAIGSGRSGGS